MHNGSIHGVILEIDGVLCHSLPFLIQAASQMFAESYNLRLHPQDFQPFLGLTEAAFLSGPAEKRGLRLALARDVRRTCEIYLRLIPGQLKPLPGTMEFLDMLRRREIRFAICSSADRNRAQATLTHLGLRPQDFHVFLTASDLPNKKPAPDLFLTAAARLNLPPSSILVIDYAPPGIQAASQANMPCLALTTSFPADQLLQAGATWTAPDLAHLPPDIPWS